MTQISEARRSVPMSQLVQQSPLAADIMLTLLFGALTALSAQIQIPTQPVPITGQVLMVLLSGALLGSRLGFQAQVTYLIFGLLGAPVFAQGKFGLAVLFGPTGGYLIVYPIAAFVVGALVQRFRSPGGLFLSMLAGSLLILTVGSCWLGAGAAMVHWHGLTGSGLAYGFAAGFAPFVLLDLVKVVAATAIAALILRRSER